MNERSRKKPNKSSEGKKIDKKNLKMASVQLVMAGRRRGERLPLDSVKSRCGCQRLGPANCFSLSENQIKSKAERGQGPVCDFDFTASAGGAAASDREGTAGCSVPRVPFRRRVFLDFFAGTTKPRLENIVRRCRTLT